MGPQGGRELGARLLRGRFRRPEEGRYREPWRQTGEASPQGGVPVQEGGQGEGQAGLARRALVRRAEALPGLLVAALRSAGEMQKAYPRLLPQKGQDCMMRWPERLTGAH